jgi:hypothetical protein
MPVVSPKAPRVKAPRVRTVNLVAPNLVRITETVGRKTTVDHYTVEPIPGAEGGMAYRMAKVLCADFLGLETADPYDLDLAAGSCECKGHLQHGHRTVCRHRGALMSLRAKGKLA